MKKLCILIFFIFPFTQAVHSQNIDIHLLKEINLNRPRFLDNIFLAITKTAKPLAIATPATVLLVGMLNKDQNLKQTSVQMFGGLIITTVLTEGLKYAVHRQRPYITYPYLENVTRPGDPSFPSGHTSVAFSTATSLSLNYPKWYVVVPSFVWASTVAYSRVDLGVHYPSDVIAGAIIGAGSAWVAYRLQKWFDRRPDKLLNHITP